MNKNKLLSTFSVVALSIASLSACAATNAPVTPPAQVAPATPAAPVPVNYTIKSIDSGVVSFSNITSSKRKGVYVISGDTKLKSSQRRILKLPGYVQVTLKASDGSELESIKARYTRKFGASSVGHFKATLKTAPPEGSQIVVEHINK